MLEQADMIRTEADRAAVAAGCRFDFASAERVRRFFGLLKHSKGRWGGQKFELLDWQWREIIAPLFGWLRPDGSRRFRVGYVEIPKKNGKSTLCSGLSLYLLIGDGEAGAEVYCAAADRGQAGIVYNESANMAEASDFAPHLMIRRSNKQIAYPRAKSLYQALSADVKTKEGLNIHGLIFDELHAQPTRHMWDTLRYGGASRRQPLLLAITTAGYDRQSICWEQHQYADSILRGTNTDWTFFPFIAAAAPDDPWDEETTWRKANPSFGITIDADDFRAAVNEAKQSPAKENSFRRYRLNQWTTSDVRAISADKWAACRDERITAEALAGERCFVGLDLSSKLDLTAAVLVFPRPGGEVAVLPYFWLPEEAAQDRERRNRELYLEWQRRNCLELIPGYAVDLGYVRRRINELATQFEIVEIAFDPWNATQIATELKEQDGFEVVEYRQGYASMSEPTKDLLAKIEGRKLLHPGHPVLTWMADNLTVETDAAGNLKPSKAKSTEKIDGLVALIMGLGRLLVCGDDNSSVYETRGILTL